MVYDSYTKRRIVHYEQTGLSVRAIVKTLKEENIIVSASGVWKFIKRYRISKTIERKKGSGRVSIVSNDIKKIIDDQMIHDDETTACQLVQQLHNEGYSISLSTALRCRTSLGWTWRGSAYCQLIREGNKTKRLIWAREYLNDDFENVVFTDETSIQQESHRRHCCRKVGHPPRPKPRYYYKI